MGETESGQGVETTATLSETSLALGRQLTTESFLVQAIMTELGLLEQTPEVLALAMELRAAIVPALRLLTVGNGNIALGHLIRAVARETGHAETDRRVRAVATLLCDAIEPTDQVIELGFGVVEMEVQGHWVGRVRYTKSGNTTPRPKNWSLDEG